MPTLTLTCPVRYPDSPGYEQPQHVQRTWGGGFRVEDLGVTGQSYRRLTLALRGMTRTEWDALYDFVVNELGWSAATFDWTDPLGNVFTGLRYLSGIPEARGRPGDRWDCDLVLAQEVS